MTPSALGPLQTATLSDAVVYVTDLIGFFVPSFFRLLPETSFGRSGKQGKKRPKNRLLILAMSGLMGNRTVHGTANRTGGIVGEKEYEGPGVVRAHGLEHNPSFCLWVTYVIC